MTFRYRSLVSSKMWLLLVILVSGLIVSGCVGFGVSQGGWSGAVVAGDRLYFGSSKGALVALNSSGGSRLWEVPFETSGGGGFGCAVASSSVTIYGSPAVGEELVFVSGFDGKVRTIIAETGREGWVYPPEGPFHPIIAGPLAAQGRVYIATTGGDVYALDETNGALLWQFENRGEIWAKPVISGDTLFISVFDKKLYALDASTGDEKWAQPFEAQGPVVASPLVYNDTLYVASFDRHIYALEADSGQLKWQFPADDGAENTPRQWFWASPVAYENTIYAANMDGQVYAIDAESGALVTTFDLEDAISSTPVVADGVIIVATQEGAIYSVDTGSGSLLKMRDIAGTIKAPLIYSGGVVYIHALADEVIYALNPETGLIIWDMTIS